MGGGKKGGGGGGFRLPDQAEEIFNMARLTHQRGGKLFNTALPLGRDVINVNRGHLMQDVNAPLTRADIEGAPQFDVMKMMTEQNFADATDRIREALPVGGQLAAALGDAQFQRAAQMTRNEANIGQRLLDRRDLQQQAALDRGASLASNMVSAGLGGSNMGMAGMTGPFAAQMQLMAAQRQAQADEKSGMGQLVGTIAGSAMTGGKIS